MLKKYSEVLGLPVISAFDGMKVGRVQDVAFRKDNKAVVAFIIEKGMRTLSGNVVLLKNVLSLGNDAVIIDNPIYFLDYKSFKNQYDMQEQVQLRGLKIYTQSGDDIGIVQDILFDYRTGRIEGVQVSDGWVQDIVQGRSILPFLGKIEIAEDNILVNREAVDEMISSRGGLKNRL